LYTALIAPSVVRATERPIEPIRRPESASPATGSHKAHTLEEQEILAQGFARLDELL
jgi:hypothetical protein